MYDGLFQGGWGKRPRGAQEEAHAAELERRRAERRARKAKWQGAHPYITKITIRKAVAGWQLCTDGACGVLPAGFRLLRHPGQWPIDRFTFEKKPEAIKAGQALAEYLQTEFVE
jgi:hypothetical protein